MVKKTGKNEAQLQCAMDEVFGQFNPFRPHASYIKGMDVLWVITKECSPIVDSVDDRDARFELLRDPADNSVVGIRIWGFSELVRKPREMARKIRDGRRERKA